MLDHRLRLECPVGGGRNLILTESLPDTEKLYEVLGGQLVAKRYTVLDSVVAGNVQGAFQRQVHGGTSIAHVLLDLPNVETFRRPAVTFVPFTDWPHNRRFPRAEAWSVQPAVVVETSVEDDREALASRLNDYFAAGVQQVWHVYSHVEQVFIFDSPTQVRVLTRADELTGDPILPGFRMPLAELFPTTAPTP